MTLEQAQEVLTLEAEGITAVRDALGEEFVQAVDLIMACPSRLVISGIGKSGLVGQKISATLNSTGTPSFFLHPVEAMHGDLGMVSSTDIVLAISYSGETSELNLLLESLKNRAVQIIAMTGNSHSTLAHAAAVTLNVSVPREACPLGLAPTTSTTATLALGDALAVALLRRKRFREEDFRRNHPGGSLGERLKVAVREVMLTGDKVPLIRQEETLELAVAELNKKNIGAVLVAEGSSKLCGIITDGDLRRHLLEERWLGGGSGEFDGSGEGRKQITEVMTPHPITISGDLMAADALSLMQGKDITVLAVVGEGNKVEGILHLHDLLGKGEFRFLI
ncbi:KpsF/GutQ family sugar-phosphate isomerase [Desulfobulbus sp. US1]|nr:KpsF/GutQ family sugar-phosphate isomerase [Desulfobulbus sp. US4]MCW5204344.1 KpsF/GutQ family sugar-phosphate isomerase [Desulfobulbus sp. N2]MCW5207506.1 KpsF/GutQ family sugar-phosphate isomerase [Desulfobulbus sp. US2]MCW5209123.1 KpsF/GutQ family sugar-phosphate isomerase [Desulfobulbus sp. US1]MCW5213886.1 KpsF/GutQ family sugar-phosphate isomerase [Desulfobulbus sp. US5]WLE99081.1 MAG: KpsF/GutQ family sugar-phosphate isomerase [Candidatus Electrothrix communis]